MIVCTFRYALIDSFNYIFYLITMDIDSKIAALHISGALLNISYAVKMLSISHPPRDEDSKIKINKSLEDADKSLAELFELLKSIRT